MAITPVKTLVAAAKSEITTLSIAETQAKLEDGSALLIDIRDIRELQKLGKLPGATHAPRGLLEFWIDPSGPYFKQEFATNRTLILYCASAWRSALAVKTLQDMGVENVAELEGGFSAWSAQGLEVETV